LASVMLCPTPPTSKVPPHVDDKDERPGSILFWTHACDEANADGGFTLYDLLLTIVPKSFTMMFLEVRRMCEHV